MSIGTATIGNKKIWWNRTPAVTKITKLIRNKIMAEVNKKQDALGVEIEVAAILIAKKYGVDVSGFLREAELEIERLKEDIKETNKKMELYQTKIEETPKREQELISLNRDYKNLQELYDSLLDRLITELSEKDCTFQSCIFGPDC